MLRLITNLDTGESRGTEFRVCTRNESGRGKRHLSAPLVNFMKLAPRVISLFLSRREIESAARTFSACALTIPFRLDERHPIKTRRPRAVFLSNRDTSYSRPPPVLHPFPIRSMLSSSVLPVLPRVISHAASLSSPRASIYQTPSGEASDNRFNR